MAIQTANLGAAPSGIGGDTFRTAAQKFNENFSTPAHAASRSVGEATGNVMEVGAFGLGSNSPKGFDVAEHKALPNGFYSTTGASGFPVYYGEMLLLQNSGWTHRFFFPATYSAPFISTSINTDNFSDFHQFLVMQRNVTVDSNGFVKAASPIVKLFSEKIELNDEAKKQDPLFEKYDVGHYIIKNTLGFSELGWYIEMPKDANGNVLVAVQYEQLENQTIEVKTFAKKFDEETGDIVPNLEKPRDIPVGRWIDIRLQEMPEPELVIPESNTPASFQPTGIAQAVSEMMNGTEQ